MASPCTLAILAIPTSTSLSTLAILACLLVSVTGDSAELYTLSGPVGEPFPMMSW